MQFLNPGLLMALLPLVVVPLIIHLLSRRVRQRQKFSSLAQLRQTAAQQSRLHRWRHLLLLALRTLAIILLLLAFLRPVWDRFGGATDDAEAQRNVVIVIDRSLSMEHQAAGNRARHRAVMEAEKILATLDRRDRVNLVAAGENVETAFVAQSVNLADARRFVQELDAGFGGADLSRANVVVGRLLRDTVTVPEVYYLSDFQRATWASVDYRALPASARVFFVDVGADEAFNRAIIDAEFEKTSLRQGDRAVLKVTVANYSAESFGDALTVRLGETASFRQPARIAPWSTTTLRIPLSFDEAGTYRLSVELPEDALEEDNLFYLTVPVSRQEEIIVATQSDPEEANAPFFLRVALNPFADERGSFVPRVIRTSELSPVALAGARKLFLSNLGEMSEEQATALANFVFRGGSIVWFLDGEHAPTNLPRLDAAMGSGVVALSLGPRHRADDLRADTQQIIRGEFDSPYLHLFRGPARQNLSLLEIYDYYQASRTGEGEVLLTFTDETPAMAEFQQGLGTVILFNFSAGELSSNLARQKLFPAWIQDIVRQLDGDGELQTYRRVGETVSAQVWPDDLRRGRVVNPAGETISPRPEPLNDRIALAWEPDAVGFYRLHHADGSVRAFAVNPAAEESDLRVIPPEQLPTFADEPAAVLRSQRDLAAVVTGLPLFQWFVLAALLCFALEQLLQVLLLRSRSKL